MTLSGLRYIQRTTTIGATLLAGGWGLLLGLTHLDGRASILDRLEAPLLDLRFQIAGPRSPSGRVVVVAIDDETVRRAGVHPLPRHTIALLVQELGQAGANAVALDILFLDRGPGDVDQALREAMREARAVTAAAAVFPSSHGMRPR
jgi:adenylate cyclase